MSIHFKYRIRLIATPGFYFSKWVFGWGLIQKILQKVDFLTKKWGFIQEKSQKQDFSISWGSIQEWGCNQADTVINLQNSNLFYKIYKEVFDRYCRGGVSMRVYRRLNNCLIEYRCSILVS